MYRKIYKNLLAWKNSQERKPLILQGARQVGKTYIVNLFGQNEYANFVYCNFEQDARLSELFETLEPKKILQQISIYKHKEIIPNHTLIIFDEIQACPKALTSLKYFNELANEYHIIATGSLLGVSVNRSNNSFPVGKVQFLTMYPLDFEEYLCALGNETDLINEIRQCFKTDSPLPSVLHERALEHYHNYLYVGGMPEVVNEYIRSQNYELVRVKQNEILESYFNDMSKYNKATEIPKTKLVYANIATQLSKENKKFQYKLLKSGARASSFEDAVEWVCLSGIASRMFRLEQIAIPLEANKSLTDFKFYMNDVGLCCASQKLLYDDVIFNKTDFEFRGGLAENYVFNQLQFNNFDLYYWKSKYDAEVDFISRINADIIPIEVKSADNTKAKSLSIYIEQYKPKYSIRISTKNFGFENNIKSIPLYAVFCIENFKN